MKIVTEAEQSWTLPEPRVRSGTKWAAPMPEGPWKDEPDKVQWIDPETDLDCLIVRGPFGALCGYVGVPPEHPWHGIAYNACLTKCGEDFCYEHSPEGQTNVHGGITYSDKCSEAETPARGICHVPLPGRSADVWWFGFDCSHSFDLTVYDVVRAEQENHAYPWDLRPDAIYRDVEYVKAECVKLAGQLSAVLG